MSVTTTSAPARARASESARPNPREPPVTTATLPLRSNIATSSCVGSDYGHGKRARGGGAEMSAPGNEKEPDSGPASFGAQVRRARAPTGESIRCCRS